MPLQARNIKEATIPVAVLTTDFASLFENDHPKQKLFEFAIFHVANVSAADCLVSICFVPALGSASASNAALWEFSIPANDFIEFGAGDYLPFGYTVQAKASAGNALNLKMSGNYN